MLARRIGLKIAFSAILLGSAGTGVAEPCALPASGVEPVLLYRFGVDRTSSGTSLHVQMQFKNSASGSTEIELPEHWNTGTVVAVSANTTIRDTPDTNTKLVLAAGGDDVILAYHVSGDQTVPLRPPMQFDPVLTPAYLEITGANALVHPVLGDETKVTFQLEWSKLPKDWVLATSFGTAERRETYCEQFSGPWKDVREALFAAGDFRLYSFKSYAGKITLAIRGHWRFSDQEAIHGIHRTMEIVRKFWKAKDSPEFLVTLQPFDTVSGIADGSAFTNAFWLYLPQSDLLANRLFQVAHEAFHDWNIRRMGEVPPGQRSRIDWFHEGFTVYYGDRLTYQDGLLPSAAYLDRINHDLERFSETNSPYVRGHVIAFWLDAAIRRDSKARKSLDDAMFAMVKENGKALTEDRILHTLEQNISSTDAQLLEAAVQQGALPPLPQFLQNPCAILVMARSPDFQVGPNFPTAQAANHFSDADSNGRADQARIRNGQEMKDDSIASGDASKPMPLPPRTGEGAYMIANVSGNKTISIPQYRAAACAILH